MGQFRFLTAGESHGKGLIAVIEGMVSGLPIGEDYIAQDLKRRQAGYGRSARMKIEQDKAEIISGVRHGLTIGSPISLLIWNRVWEDWREVMSVASIGKKIQPINTPRPGHADLAGITKYGVEDIRLVLERASARETAVRVAVGAVARRFLDEFGISMHSHTISVGKHLAKQPKSINWKQVEKSPVRCADATAEKAMMAAIDEAKAEGDTLGGVFEVIAAGVPVGLGSHVQWDRRLNGQIAQAVMSIPAIKGVEIGDGFSVANKKGSKAQDVIEISPKGAVLPWHRATNNAGGIEGGMSNGEPIVVRAAVKPIATLGKPLPSIDLKTGKKAEAHYERSDICVVPAAGVIGEAMLSVVLANAMLEKFGGDHLKETLANYKNYISSAYSHNRHAASKRK
ncbi:MAG: chorismate synthase [Chloroflexi bacterium RBG_13_48_17]|nr:MAG: chorismate synthase [Chloroflexi bacterium RBG_13_48_17]